MKTKFHILCINVVMVLVLAACQGAAVTPAPVQTDNTEQNMAVVRRFYEEFAKGNADVILEVHAQTITMHYAGEAEVVETQVLRDDLAAIQQANPDLHAEIKDMFAQGDIVVTELTWTGTHTGDLFGIPATGKTYLHNGIVVRRLENGKIVESWEMWDDLAFLNNIGYVPSWDEIVANQGQAAIPEIFVSQPEQLVGVWRGRGGAPGDPPQSYWWFKPDGTYTVTFTLEQFNEGYYLESGKFGFDGTRLILQATSKGCAHEPAEVNAMYEANLTLKADGSPDRLKLKPISDECTSRKNGLGGGMPYVQAQP